MSEPTRLPNQAPDGGELDTPPLTRRVFRPSNILSFFLALIVLYLVYRQLLGLDWREVWASVQEASVGLFVLAFAIFYCSFFFRALRWEVMLSSVGYSRPAEYPMPSVFGLTRIMYLAWFANCVTVARLGDAYRGYLLKKEAGVSFAVTLGTVLAERLLDLIVLTAIMCVGVLVAFGGSLPTGVAQILAAGLILSAIGIIGLLAMRRFRGAFERIIPKRLRAHYVRLEYGLVGSARRLPLLLSYSVAGWLIEGTTLYVIAAAVGVPISVAGALVIALAASLLTTVPFTPAGLGFAEVGMVVMLQWLGLDVTTASAITLLFRLINYWSIVLLGFVLYILTKRPINARMNLPLAQGKE